MKRIIETGRTAWQQSVLAAAALLYGARRRLLEAFANDAWRKPGMRCAAIAAAAALCAAALGFAACRWKHAEHPNQSVAPAAAKPRKTVQTQEEVLPPASSSASTGTGAIAEASAPPDEEPEVSTSALKPASKPPAVARKPASTHATPSAIHASATVTADERRVYVVAPKFDGWIEKLHANTTGQEIKRGQILFDTYSTEFETLQKSYRQHRSTAALARLARLGIAERDLEHLRKTGTPSRTLMLRSPISGVVTEKKAVRGMRFSRGEALYRITDLSSVWVIADVPEKKISAVRAGQPATVTFSAYPGRSFHATVAYVYPTADPHTHAVPVRLQLPNEEMLLKPGMRAVVDIVAKGGKRKVMTRRSAR
jgi:multidrug efflux pump subunit AcrA (membrane-fusion protein)